jgi:hypothetical protein
MKRILLLLLLAGTASAQTPAVPPIPPIGAFCLPTVASLHTLVNPSTGNTVVSVWCDLVSGTYHYEVAGNSTNWSQAQCLTTIEPFSPTALWLQHAWGACVTTYMSSSDQAYAGRLVAMWWPRPTVLGTTSQPILTVNTDGTLGPPLSIAGVAQTLAGGTVTSGLRLSSGTVSPRYCYASNLTSDQGTLIPANSYVLCTLALAPLGGFVFPTSANGVSIQAPTEAFLVDAAGHVWGIDAKGIITVDAIEDSTSANVTALVWIGGLIWQRNASNLWWSKSAPSAPWLPAGGTTTAPM